MFPGVAVAEWLVDQGVEARLLVSEKEIDRLAREGAPGLRFVPLAGGGFSAGRRWMSLAATWRGWRQARRMFQDWRPHVLLSMGGFAGVAPVLAARTLRIPYVLHEANAFPGRATRWLASGAKQVLLAFEECRPWLKSARSDWTGMPVRRDLGRMEKVQARRELGLSAERPVMLVMGGSQGARAINDLFLAIRETLRSQWKELQTIHVTGPRDFERVSQRAGALGPHEKITAFETRMDRVLGAASFVVTRAGGSSIAELAAMSLPSILIPFPAAADDHQRRNAEVVVGWGGARMLAQSETTPDRLLREVLAFRDEDLRLRMAEAMSRVPVRQAAARVGVCLLEAAGCRVEPGMEGEAVFESAPSSPRPREGVPT